jgi:hypothetical protein
VTCTEERFLSDVADHTLGIVYDDGTNRCIRFRASDTSNCWFEVVTWPGILCINGDHGCYVFSRLSDMFKFFRHGEANGPGKPLYINDGYWAEKLVAASDRGGHGNDVRQWSANSFRSRLEKRLTEHLKEAEDQEQEEWGPEQEDELRAAIEELADNAEEGEHEAIASAYRFKLHGLTFKDAYEWDCTEWNFHFIWCLYAIAWGIRKYDDIEALIAEGGEA